MEIIKQQTMLKAWWERVVLTTLQSPKNDGAVWISMAEFKDGKSQQRKLAK